MAKASITKKYSLSANGILDVTDDGVSIDSVAAHFAPPLPEI